MPSAGSACTVAWALSAIVGLFLWQGQPDNDDIGFHAEPDRAGGAAVFNAGELKSSASEVSGDELLLFYHIYVRLTPFLLLVEVFLVTTCCYHGCFPRRRYSGRAQSDVVAGCVAADTTSGPLRHSQACDSPSCSTEAGGASSIAQEMPSHAYVAEELVQDLLRRVDGDNGETEEVSREASQQLLERFDPHCTGWVKGEQLIHLSCEIVHYVLNEVRLKKPKVAHVYTEQRVKDFVKLHLDPDGVCACRDDSLYPALKRLLDDVD
eukprot:TRINITY_DN56444_c0_g1_i1.p1 TRINITY_DN56444_c0_g1~~TRINITY_DN56444_c0_g1_i1.p1  ORF type:complete len:265 (-),score=30.15 TRINITY_DN56444_c0_g1_i1:135-929(-)